MTTIPFFKYHALGNDYLVIDPNRFSILFELSVPTIQKICHRHYGIGSDGILYGPILKTGEIPRVQIFNPDGSEAEKSGNGVRIFSRFMKEMGYVHENFLLQTLGGVVQVEFLDSTAQMIRVDMGKATFESTKIPVSGPPRQVIQEPITLQNQVFQITCLSVGNPHCVIPLTEISEALAKELGPQLETHPLFPHRINIQLLKILNRKKIQIEIWERGAGYTLASGSSSCAAAAAAYRLGLIDSSVSVQMPGGVIQIDQNPKGSILMTGPVTRVAQGEMDLELLLNSI